MFYYVFTFVFYKHSCHHHNDLYQNLSTYLQVLRLLILH
nr:MAG TPA: hypothetical protein [Caudoviricetes sp.]